jgi:hypothetical protein
MASEVGSMVRVLELVVDRVGSFPNSSDTPNIQFLFFSISADCSIRNILPRRFLTL